jgi:hypothetical protein
VLVEAILSQMAVDAFESLIVLNFEYPDWSKTSHVFEAVAELAKTKYNYTYRPDEMVSAAVF